MFANYDDHEIRRSSSTTSSWKSSNEIAPNCPRCASSNTKFCYYNNYSLSQPRYFCKGCRRYWTKGGSLRNVPVGGGCRKTRRSKSARGQDQRLGLSHYQLISSSGSSDSNNTNTTSDHGANIDLAAVFAKFLNQDSIFTTEDQEFSSGTTSSGSQPERMPMSTTTTSDHINDQMENILFDQSSELQQPLDCYSNFDGDDHDQYQYQKLQELLLLDDDGDHGHHPLMEFEGILGGDDQEKNNNNIGWTTSLPNLDMQNDVEFQDLGPFSIEDDHTQFLSNIGCEDWSSFDLSEEGY